MMKWMKFTVEIETFGWNIKTKLLATSKLFSCSIEFRALHSNKTLWQTTDKWQMISSDLCRRSISLSSSRSSFHPLWQLNYLLLCAFVSLTMVLATCSVSIAFAICLPCNESRIVRVDGTTAERTKRFPVETIIASLLWVINNFLVHWIQTNCDERR